MCIELIVNKYNQIFVSKMRLKSIALELIAKISNSMYKIILGAIHTIICVNDHNTANCYKTTDVKWGCQKNNSTALVCYLVTKKCII